MLWKLLADLVVLFHAAVWLFVIAGPLLVRRSPRGKALHAAASWISAVTLTFYCPLTAVETSLRFHYDPRAAYAGGFLRHYMNRLAGWNPDMPALRAAAFLWAILWTALHLSSAVRAFNSPSSKR